MDRKDFLNGVMGAGEYPELERVKLLQDRILVKPAEAEKKTASGIIIPDAAKETPQRGTIVAMGAGFSDKQMETKMGDEVLYGKFTGTEIELDGQTLMLMREADVFAIL